MRTTKSDCDHSGGGHDFLGPDVTESSSSLSLSSSLRHFQPQIDAMTNCIPLHHHDGARLQHQQHQEETLVKTSVAHEKFESSQHGILPQHDLKSSSSSDDDIHDQKRCIFLASITLLISLVFFALAISSGVRPAKRLEKTTSTSSQFNPNGMIASHFFPQDSSDNADDDYDYFENEDYDYYDDQFEKYSFEESTTFSQTSASAEKDNGKQAQLDNIFEYSASSTTNTNKNATTTSKNSGTTMNNIAGVNDGGECSLLTPVNYNRKFQHGAGYEGIPGFQCYRTVNGTRQTVNDLLLKYPLLASRVFLGNYRTVELGQRLSALVITNQKSNPPSGGKGKLLVVSSIHARELTTAETMTRFAEYLLQNYGIDPDVTWILDYVEIHLILHANPDGRVYLEKGGEHKLWKKNRNNSEKCNNWQFGVDPNRNFPFKWGECDDSDGSLQTCATSSKCQSVVYRGRNPKSEVETKAIVEYAASIFPTEQRKGSLQFSEANYKAPFAKESEGVFIDVHSHGQYVGWPWGFVNQRSPNDEGLGALGRKLASFNGYRLWAPQMPNRLYGFDGGAIDTMYGWLGVASFFLELGTSFYQPCDTFPDVINEVFPSLLYAAKVSKAPYAISKGPDVLCTNISVNNTSAGKYVYINAEVSDSARVKHTDDSSIGNLFFPGRQAISYVEIFVDCHPYSGANCQPTNRKVFKNADTSITLSMRFKAPATGRKTHVMYIRATDSANNQGPVTARSFIL